MADILLAIPDLIEHIHSCVKFAQAYSKIDDSFASDIDHAEQVSKTVGIMADLLRQNKSLQAESEIASSLEKLEKALCELQVKLEKWKKTMQYDNNSSAAASSSSSTATLDGSNVEKTTHTGVMSGVTSSDLESALNMTGDTNVFSGKCSFACGMSGFRWIRYKVSFFIRWKRGRMTQDEKGGVKAKIEAAHASCKKALHGNAVVGAVRRAQFLTFVDPGIKETLKQIDRALEDLFRFFNLSMMFSRVVFNDEAREFVERARRRIASQLPVQRLDIPCTSLIPLDDAFNEDSECPQSLFYVDGGDYADCLIDRRFVRHLVNKRRGQETLAETERVARMMAEEPQDKKGITSANVPVLRSCGIALPHRHGDIHDVVFRMPMGCQVPQTLRRALVSPGPAPNLRTRANLAFHLATALDIIHRLDVVHKRVRPESIVLIRHVDDNGVSSDGYSPSLGMPYLAGFIYARQEVAESNMTPIYGSAIPELIYHHPRHVDMNRRQAYQTHDDIYSLGISLLEIGLWRSIVCWDETASRYVLDKYWKIDYMDYVLPDKRLPPKLWFRRRSDLIQLAKRELPQAMGPTYAEVVTTCLEFAERNERARTLVEDSNVGGADFVRDVVSKLYELHL